MIKKKMLLFMLPVFFGKHISAQTTADTTAMVNEFTNVMSFVTKPYLYFTTVTTINASPVFFEHDTMSLKGAFYKNDSGIYYNNGTEEVYLQDSFMIRIHQKRKSIWISKIDIANKTDMTLFPVNNEGMKAIFRKNYTITKITINSSTSRLDFTARQETKSSPTLTTGIRLEYQAKDHLPTLIELVLQNQQPLNDELLAELKKETTKDVKLFQTKGEGNVKYLMRKQVISIAFGNISTSKEKTTQMPSWKDIIDYDGMAHEFVPKGMYKDYEVVKMF